LWVGPTQAERRASQHKEGQSRGSQRGRKETAKKELGFYAMNLGCCDVTTVAQGANPQQMVKGLHEAEEFLGTSIVIALCSCINWRLKQRQGNPMKEQKLAVETGYWPLYRYHPLLKKEGKNPLTLDSPPPKKPVSEMVKGETRFLQLEQLSKETAAVFHQGVQTDIDERIARLQKIAEVN
jgi:pyruvate-ferredoxin/flavodoxin oxidoreductase